MPVSRLLTQLEAETDISGRADSLNQKLYFQSLFLPRGPRVQVPSSKSTFQQFFFFYGQEGDNKIVTDYLPN